MKRKIVGILVCMLVIAIGSASGITNQSNEISNEKTITAYAQPFSLQFHQEQTPIIQPTGMTSPQSRKTSSAGTDTQVTTFTETDSHPCVEIDNDGNPMIVYDHDTGLGYHEVYLQRSLDGGKTWPADKRYYLAGNESASVINPVIELVDNGTRALVLCQVEPLDPRFCTVDLPDINDPATWVVIYGQNASINPWVGQPALDIVGDQMGVWAYICHMIWAGFDVNRTFTMSWASDIDNGSTSSGVFFTPSAVESFSGPAVAAGSNYLCGAVQYNRAQGGSQIIITLNPVKNLSFYNLEYRYISTTYSHNLTNPDLVASGEYLYLAVQTDEKGNNDILCYNSNGSSWKKHVVVESSDDEMYPSVTAVGTTVLCTFVKNGNIYSTKSEDGGITWSAPEQISDEAASISAEYHCANVEGPYIAWMDNRNTNTDIYADITTMPWVALKRYTGGLGCSIEITNVGTGDATDIEYDMKVQGGVQGLINFTKNGTIDIAAGKSTKVRSGVFFGLGKILMTATIAGGMYEKEGKHFFFFSIVK